MVFAMRFVPSRHAALLVALLAAGAASSPALRAACAIEDRDLVTNEFLVILRPDAGETIEAVLARHAAARAVMTETNRIPQIQCYQYLVTDGTDLDALSRDLEQDGAIDKAEAHEHIENPEGVQRSIADIAIDVTRSDFLAQPAATLTHAPLAHAQATGRGVLVAIVDTAAAVTNPETSSRMAGPGIDVIGGGPTADVPPNGIDEDQDTLIDESAQHGAFAAGLVLLAAPDAGILHVRALTDDGNGESFTIAKGIVAAVDAGANVISLSLGLTHDARPVERAVEYAADRGVVLVAAAGNRGTDTAIMPCVDFPADRDEVIAVAAVDDAFLRAPWSSYGGEVALSAPAVDILSTHGATSWARWSGTSFAAPLVAGGAALLLERYPGLAPAQVKDVLQATAQPYPVAPTPPDTMGTGVLDLAALSTVLTTDRATLRIDDDPDDADPPEAEWEEVEGASTHDLVRGDLASVRVNGAVIDLGPLTCIANDVPPGAPVRLDTDRPGPGRSFFYLLRDDGADPEGGSYGRDSRGRARVPGATDCP
jgi:subtilisin family serine protease